jgi:hypothetical protein
VFVVFNAPLITTWIPTKGGRAISENGFQQMDMALEGLAMALIRLVEVELLWPLRNGWEIMG